MDHVNQFSRHISLENVQPRATLLNASSTGSLVGDLRLGRASFHRRTAEGSRLIRENFNSVIQEIRPLVEQARTVNASGISISTLLSTTTRPTPPEQAPENQSNSSNEDTFVINLEAVPPAQNAPPTQDNNSANNGASNNAAREQQNGVNNTNNNNNNNNVEEGPTDTLRQFVEAHAFLQILQRYVPFVLILLAKALYDHREGILNFIILFITFSHANSVVKKEATRQGRRSFSKLCVELVYISACIIFIGYIFEDEKLYLNLVFIPPYTKPLTVWELLWTVGITDFILKLLTIMLKIGITMFSVRLLPFQKRVSIVAVAFFTKRRWTST